MAPSCPAGITGPFPYTQAEPEAGILDRVIYQGCAHSEAEGGEQGGAGKLPSKDAVAAGDLLQPDPTRSSLECRWYHRVGCRSAWS